MSAPGWAAAAGGLSLARQCLSLAQRKECRKRNQKMSPGRRHFHGDVLLIFGICPGISWQMPPRFGLACFSPAEVCPRWICHQQRWSVSEAIGLIGVQ